MKKKLISMAVALTLVCTSAISIFANTDVLSSQIITLEKEVSTLESQYHEISKGMNAVMGKIILSEPYFIVLGCGIGNETTMNSIPYFMIQNPDYGTISGDYYSGTHKYIGTQIITLNGKKISVNVVGALPRNCDAIYNSMVDKRNELKELYTESNSVENFELSPEETVESYINDADNDIAFQVGNPYMCLYGALCPVVKLETDSSTPTVAPMMINNTMYAPIDYLISVLGGTTEYDTESQTLNIKLENAQALLTIDCTTAIINGNEKTLTNPAKIIDSNVMIPLSILSDDFNINSDWDPTTQVITLHYSNDWTNHVDSYLNIDNNNYIFNDVDSGCTFTYPKSWGKPQFPKEGYEVHTIMFVNGNSKMFVSLKNNGGVNDYDINFIKNDIGEESIDVSLTSQNTGIEKIRIRELPHGGEAEVLCNKNYILYCTWVTSEYASDDSGANLTYDKDKTYMQKEALEFLSKITSNDVVG